MKRAALALIFSLVATAAVAGDGNQAYLIQLSPEGTPNGNTLSIDQQGANDSLVRGIDDKLIGYWPALLLRLATGADPMLATQRGEGNQASLSLTGSGGELQLLQTTFLDATWAPGEAGGYNIAELTASGNALGGVIQIGELNQAKLSLGADAKGLIGQWGTELSATLNVAASGGSGAILQIGNNSNAEFNLLSDNSVTYVQIGDNLNSVDASVYSSIPGDIFIKQIAF